MERGVVFFSKVIGHTNYEFTVLLHKFTLLFLFSPTDKKSCKNHEFIQLHLLLKIYVYISKTWWHKILNDIFKMARRHPQMKAESYIYSPRGQTFDPECFQLYIVFQVKILKVETNLPIITIFIAFRSRGFPLRRKSVINPKISTTFNLSEHGLQPI